MTTSTDRRLWGIRLLIVVVVFATFGRLMSADFLTWDDGLNVWMNPKFNPVSWASVGYYWMHPAYGLYMPVTYTVWAALAKLAWVQQVDTVGSQLNPWVFHSANLVAHAAAALLVFELCRRLSLSLTSSLLGTLLFAVHPLQVESVAWVSGLKDLVCTGFGFSAVLLYLRAIQSMRFSRLYTLATCCLILSVLSKPTGLAMPWIAAALLCIWLRRPLREHWRSLAPWLLLSLATAVGGRLFQQGSGVPAAPLWQRPLICGDALAFYGYKLIWPFSLGIDYGRTPALVIQHGYLWWTWLLPLAAALWIAGRCSPEVVAAALVFLLGVAPVLGLLTFMFQRYSTTADHYLYPSMLGTALLFGLAIQRSRAWVTVIGVAVIGALAMRSFAQTRYWQDDSAVYQHALTVNPRSWASLSNLARLQFVSGNLPAAEQYCRRAIAVNPDNWESHRNLAKVLRAEGDSQGDLEQRLQAMNSLMARPDGLEAGELNEFNALESELIESNQFDQAHHYQQWVEQVAPNDGQVIKNRAELAKRSP